MDEKVLQEFRIIETDDGFRIEIKGNKEELREFVMSLDPRQWMRHGFHRGHHPHGRGFRFGPGGFFGFGGPWGWWGEEGEEESPKHKHGHEPGPGSV